SAMPASSMMINVDGPTAVAQSDRLPSRKDQVSLAGVSARMPVCSARTAAAAADGARPSTWPPSWVQASVIARHGGGLARAGWGDRELQPGTRGAHLVDQRSLTSIQGRAVRRHLQ